MTEKATLTEAEIISLYMNHILEHYERPKSVHAFSKAHHFEESLFYKYFGNFEALEKAVFSAFYEHTVSTLHKSEDYPSFDARNKLLSFYYTFFENLTANRSYVMYALGKGVNSPKTLSMLSGLKKHFTAYIDELEIETFNLNQQQLAGLQKKSLRESAWVQLLLTLKFWIDDTSASFQKTDIFIEKSVNTSFDLLDTQPLKSVIDFGKFILKEKINPNV